MINLKDGQITDTLPESLAEQWEVKALSFAIKSAMEKWLNYSDSVGFLHDIDSASENVLDTLAVELDTQYYETDLDVKVKRKLVKNTLLWYQKAGTPSAVAELVEAVFGAGEVIENWDFKEGEKIPYTFDIETYSQTQPVTVETLLKMIKNVKNARSRLRGIKTLTTLRQTLYYASTFQTHLHQVIPKKER